MAKKKMTGVGTILGYQSRADMAVAQAVEAGSEVALSPLFSILPDPNQPRDLLPEHLYERLFKGESPPTVMQAWLTLTKGSDASPAQKRAVIALEQLASTIEHHDLIQPIAICDADEVNVAMPDGVHNVIVAGERRWWAHVWLYTKNKEIKGREADHIRTVAVSPGSNIRAMQLIENTMRENLTAIERAHGLTALREEMSKDKDKLVPWATVERELGIDRPYRWRIQQVLTLSNEAQDIVRWYGLPEKAIRPVTTSKELQDRPDLQVQALEQLIRWQDANEEAGNARLAQYIKQLLKVREPRQVDLSPDPVRLGQTFRKRASTAMKVFKGLGNGTMLQIAVALSDDEEAQDELIALEQRIAEMRQHWGR